MRTIAVFAAAGLFAAAGVARAQTSGPVEPPPKYETKKIAPQPKVVAPPPVPVDDIIHRFAANEDRMKKAYDEYAFDQSVRVQEMSDPGGAYIVEGEMYMKSDGQRYERIVKQPVSTLKQTAFTLEDVKTIVSLPLFVLTTDQLPNYNLRYEGVEKLDELNTYIFRVQPKQVSRKQAFFDGVVWVDNRDFAIVKSSGKFVREVEPEGAPLPFTMFDTYRENIDGKYWFPTYISSDDFISVPGGQNLPMRLVVRSKNFAPN
ncbi:MAG: hypothetical protein WAM08_15600, partial [Candidatus Acidiferrales bacterium]